MSAIGPDTARLILVAMEGRVQEKWVLRLDTGREIACAVEVDGDQLVTVVTPVQPVVIASGDSFTIERQVTVTDD